MGSEGDGANAPLRRRVRAQFDLCGFSYRIPVTDPAVEAYLLPRDDDECPVDDALLCISLSEIFQGYAYKLAAALFTPP